MLQWEKIRILLPMKKNALLRVLYFSGEEIQKVVNGAFKNADPAVVKAAAKMVFGRK